MSQVHITINPFILNGGFRILIDRLYNGEIGQNDFVKEAHQQGVPIARIEWEIESLKMTDGVL